MTIINRRKFLTQAAGLFALGSISSTFLTACQKQKPNFKLGVCDWTLGKIASPLAYAQAKSIGLDGLQVSSKQPAPSGEFFTPEEIASFKAAMASTGMLTASTSPTCMNPHPFYKADGAVEFTCKAIDAAKELGAKNILLPFYGPANMQDKNKKFDEAHFKPLVERLKQVAPYAQKQGVLVSMENSLNAEENIRIIDAVGSDFIKVYADVFNFEYYGHNTLDCLKKLSKKYIGEIHIKDKGHRIDSKSGMPQNMEACFDAILEMGYEGWLVLELHGHNPKKDGTIDEVLSHNVKVLKSSKLFS